jgi:hypothetical protein
VDGVQSSDQKRKGGGEGKKRGAGVQGTRGDDVPDMFTLNCCQNCEGQGDGAGLYLRRAGVDNGLGFVGCRFVGLTQVGGRLG